MSKGFLWFAQNNSKTDYVELSISLAKSIKRWNKDNQICVITDEKSKFQDKNIDFVKVITEDASSQHEIKWANEYKAFSMSPFTHTIKLEADMAWTSNTDWWWYHLWQHDLVFSVDCLDYRDNVIKDTPYRMLFKRNCLPNIYNGLMYFRKSQKAMRFYQLAEQITNNWEEVKNTMLYSCHDKYPSTDVVFALAYRIMDPTFSGLIDYDWFKFIHNKPAVNKKIPLKYQNEYLFPNRSGDALFIGETRVSRPWHYHEKELHARIF
jgi:hypothetical protein|tara:strand:- start:1643 stop:2437 length:795 start_codon:yes stop_codon:yes gene_type:complete